MTARLYGLHNYMLYPSTQKDTDIYGNITKTTWTYDYDKGYLTNEHTEYRSNNEYGNNNMYKEKTYSYGNQKIAGAWRPNSVHENQKHVDSNNIFSRQINYTYNQYGLKTRIEHYYDISRRQYADYLYDSHGNVLQDSISGTGITNPVVTTAASS